MLPEVYQSTYEDASGTFATNATREISEGDLRQFATDIRETFAPLEGSSIDTVSKLEDDFIMRVISANLGRWLDNSTGTAAGLEISVYGINSIIK